MDSVTSSSSACMFIPMNNSLLDLSWLLIYKAGTNRRMPGIMVCHPGIFTVYQRLSTDDHNFRFVQQGFHLVNNRNTLWMVPGGRILTAFSIFWGGLLYHVVSPKSF